MPASTTGSCPLTGTIAIHRSHGENKALLDSCVLAEATVSDLLLRLSEDPQLIRPVWSTEIWREARRTYVDRLGWSEALADSRISAALEFFPEAMVYGYESRIPDCGNHPKDRHVLAAAISSGTKVIVTFNIKDFKPEALEPWGVSVEHPHERLTELFYRDRTAVLKALERMASKAQRSVPEILARLAWYVRPFSELVSNQLSIKVPDIPPRRWRG